MGALILRSRKSHTRCTQLGKILCTMLHKAYHRQDEETMYTLSKKLECLSSRPVLSAAAPFPKGARTLLASSLSLRYSSAMAHKRLANFVQNLTRMSGGYQPVMIVTPLQEGAA